MKIRFSPHVIALLCAGLLISPGAYAQTESDSHKTMSLESEVAALKREMHALKQQLAFNSKDKQETKTIQLAQDTNSREWRRSHRLGNIGEELGPKKKRQLPGEKKNPQNNEPSVLAPNPPTPGSGLSRADLVKLFAEGKSYLPFDLDVPGQSFVSTGPYVGVPIQFSGSNLLVNSPSVNTDLQLLAIRKVIHKQLNAMGGLLFDEPYHSHLLMSGLVEVQAGYINNGGAPSNSGVDVTNMSLDFFYIGPSDWTLGFIEFMYNNVSPRNDVWDSHNGYTVSNSRVFVNKAFITIGNLDKTRWYSTFGQFYVPFGVYSSVMVSDTLPKLVARTKGRALLVGFAPDNDKKNSFFASAYIFRGDSHANSTSRINNGGINVGLLFDLGCVTGKIGAGVIGNIADSGGMQLGNGFANYEQIVHRVPAYNLRATIDIGEHFDIIAEYVGATKKYNPNDMSFNNHGAKPSALDIELSYSFTILCDRPSSIGIGYGKSNQALSLGIPLTRTSLVLNTSFWRNTLQSLEFRHDRNYAASDVANGPIFSPVPSDSTCKSASCSGNGKSDNAVTAQFDYYF